MSAPEKIPAKCPPGLRQYDADAWSAATAIDTGEETLVQQHFADEVDINNIVRRFGLANVMSMDPGAGFYGDFSAIEDFESAREQVERTHERFMSLPPLVRERFGNDPAQMLRWAVQAPDEFQRMVTPDAGVPPSAAGDSVQGSA